MDNSPIEKGGDMSFAGHLQELRKRLLFIFISIILFSIVSYFFREIISDFLINFPLKFISEAKKPKVIATAPTEMFLVEIKIAAAAGFVSSLPITLYNIWSFVAPGLLKKERVAGFFIVLSSTIFFAAGAFFALYYIVPFSFRFLMEVPKIETKPMLTMDAYFGFILKITMAFGIVFELPVASFILSKMGLLSSRFLIKNFKFALVIMFIIAAFLTPPDPVSQIMMAIPLIFLYLLSIIVTKIGYKE